MTNIEINKIGVTLAKIKSQIEKESGKSLPDINIHSVLKNINKYKTEYAIEISRLSSDSFVGEQPIKEVDGPNISEDDYKEMKDKCDLLKIGIMKPVVEFTNITKFEDSKLYLFNLLYSEDSYKKL